MEGFGTPAKLSLSHDPRFLKFSSILPSSGAIVDDIRDEVPESVVVKFFGPKASKSGWKYARYTTPEEASAIHALWTRVYDDNHMPNKEISLQFARGLILQQTQPVNWAEFAVRRQRYREQVRESKKNSIVKIEKCGEISGGVQVLGKKRLQGSRGEGMLPVLKLSVKDEVGEECAMGKKVAATKGKGDRVRSDDVAPRWMQSDLLAMSGVIESTEGLLAGCREELKERVAEVERLEGQLRRAEIMLSDRVVMLEEHERELANFEEQHAVLRSKIAETESLFCKGLGSEVLSSSLVADKLQSDENSLSMALAAKSSAHCQTVVLGCRASVASIEGRLRESLERQSNVQSRVKGLECLIVGMHDQFKKMNEGTGHAFFPRPVGNNPEKPVSTVHVLNACPVCGYWYAAHNFVPLCCGHTYHLFCLSQHATTSSVCCFQDCKEEFSEASISSIGIRVSSPNSYLDCKVKIEGAEAREGGKSRTVGKHMQFLL